MPAAQLSVDSRHLLQLHAQLDDFELIEPGDLFGAVALLALAQGDLVGHADELAMRVGVVPAGAAEAEERVGGGADVVVVDEAEGRLVAQLGADGRPLLEDRGDDEQRNERRRGDRDWRSVTPADAQSSAGSHAAATASAAVAASTSAWRACRARASGRT